MTDPELLEADQAEEEAVLSETGDSLVMETAEHSRRAAETIFRHRMPPEYSDTIISDGDILHNQEELNRLRRRQIFRQSP